MHVLQPHRPGKAFFGPALYWVLMTEGCREQGYIRGYLLRSQAALVLGKSKMTNTNELLSVESQGFPPPATIYVDGGQEGEDEQ